MATLGGLIGMAIAYRLKRRNPAAEVWLTVTAWTLAGAIVASLVQIVSEILF